MSIPPPREASRATHEGIIISKYPDVCRSPTAPVPYTIIAYQDDDANTASSVFMTGQRAHKQNSIVTKCTGDEPGTGLGVKSNTVSSICHRKEHSKTVRIEGQWATRDSDAWWMNNKNTIGKLVWPKHQKSFDPTPPFKEYEKPTNSASDEGRVLSDASPEPLVMGAQYAQAAVAPVPQTGGGTASVPLRTVPKVVPQTPPEPVKTPSSPANDNKPPNRWWKWVRDGLKWGRTATSAATSPAVGGAAAGAATFGGLAGGAGFLGLSHYKATMDNGVRQSMGLAPRTTTPFGLGTYELKPLSSFTPPSAKKPEEEDHEPAANGRTAQGLSVKGNEEEKKRRRRNCRLRKYSEGCADALPYSTPHHVVPDRVFREPGSSKLYDPGLSHGDGYTLCVDGGTPRFSGPLANEHGLIHALYDAEERSLGQAGNPTGTARLRDLELAGVKAASQVTGCNAIVMLKQLQRYHRSKGLPGDMRFRATKSKPFPSSSDIGHGSGNNGL